jgi:hypothetical protein
MSYPEDINRKSQDQNEQIEKDVQKLPPLGMKQPTSENGDIQSSAQKPISEILKEICPSMRDYIGSYISLADAKAGILIGVFSGLLSLAISKGSRILTVSISKWNFLDYLTFADWAFFVLAVSFAIFVVWPKMPTCSKKGFISWVHISGYKNVDGYLKDILLANESEIARQFCELNYDLSKVCLQKHFWLSWSFKAGLLASILLGLLLVINYF